MRFDIATFYIAHVITIYLKMYLQSYQVQCFHISIHKKFIRNYDGWSRIMKFSQFL